MRKGYFIIKRNYRSFSGEVDIIAFDPSSKTVVFVEVKHRKRGSLVSPTEAVTTSKAEKVRKTALHFLSEFRANYNSIRFDVVSVVDGRVEEHIENAF